MSIVIESGKRGGFLENTIRMNLPKGAPLGFGEICVDFWDFWRGDPEVAFLLLLLGLASAPQRVGRGLGSNYGWR
eukprot:COSAG05_NODE_3526_length_2009_cov_18.687958_1_plen_74_part_10